MKAGVADILPIIEIKPIFRVVVVPSIFPGRRRNVEEQQFRIHRRASSRKMALIAAVEADEVPDASILAELQAGLRALAPAMMEEVRLARSGAPSAATVEALSPRSGRSLSRRVRSKRFGVGIPQLSQRSPRPIE